MDTTTSTSPILVLTPEQATTVSTHLAKRLATKVFVGFAIAAAVAVVVTLVTTKNEEETSEEETTEI